MSDYKISDMFLQQSEPTTPASSAPKLNELSGRVRSRRLQRRIVAACWCGTIGLCAIAVAIVWPSLGSGSGKDAPRSSENVAVVESPSRDEITFPGADPLVEGVQVFATVSQRIPIFGLQRDTQLLYHVGWIDSEEIIPVDVSQFPSDQQQNFKALLDESATPTFLSL
jgi:hypothetical protein